VTCNRRPATVQWTSDQGLDAADSMMDFVRLSALRIKVVIHSKLM
jgi:hypothetical protein